MVAALGTWVAGLDKAEASYEHHLLEALWVYEHHDVVQENLLRQLLGAQEFRARAAAVRVLQHWSDRVTDATALMEKAANDPSPRVRLEAVRSLSYVPTAEATDAALDVLKHTTDYYIQYALDSTITTLEKAWRPALAEGRRISADHPEGLAYLLARLSPSDLTSLPRSEPVYHELLSRPGVERQYREEALEGLVGLRTPAAGRRTAELLSAIARVDGRPGSGSVCSDLGALLVAGDARSLSDARAELEHLALNGRTDTARRAAWAALVKVDGGLDRAWQLASSSARHRVDLIDAMALVDDDGLKRALYPLVSSILSAPVSAAPVTVSGRYVRVMLPGRERTLGLAEVEVLSGGTNIAPKGATSQSSGIPGGDFGGGAAEAVDGNTDVAQAGKAASFTTRELDPWWEIDLGAERPVDTLVVRPYLAEGANQPRGAARRRAERQAGDRRHSRRPFDRRPRPHRAAWRRPDAGAARGRNHRAARHPGP